MYNTLSQAALAAIQYKSIDAIGAEVVNTADNAVAAIVELVMQLINVAVVPLALAVLVITIGFLIVNIAVVKRQQNNEGLEEKTKALIICLVVFVIIGGYGLLFGDLLKFITG